MIVVYPGSFDPITNGHIDIINRIAKIADEVIIAVLDNVAKKSLFDTKERVELIIGSVSLPNVRIMSFSGLLVNFAREVGAKAIVRGLRGTPDFEDEFKYALNNRLLNEEIETIFLSTNAKLLYLSSSIVKEVASFGGDISKMVPPLVEARLKEKYIDKY